MRHLLTAACLLPTACLLLAACFLLAACEWRAGPEGDGASAAPPALEAEAPEARLPDAATALEAGPPYPLLPEAFTPSRPPFRHREGLDDPLYLPLPENDPDLPDHPVGGVDFQPNESLAWKSLLGPESLWGAIEFCERLTSLDSGTVTDSFRQMVREEVPPESQAQVGPLNRAVFEMVCKDYYGRGESAIADAYRMLSRLDMAREFGITLGSERDMHTATTYAVLMLMRSDNPADRVMAFEWSRKNGLEARYYGEDGDMTGQPDRKGAFSGFLMDLGDSVDARPNGVVPPERLLDHFGVEPLRPKSRD